MLPFDVKLKKRIKIKEYLIYDNSEILNFFKKEFIDRKADNVRIENNTVRFNNNFFKFINNWNIMVPVDKGILVINNDKNEEIEIEYSFSLKVTLVIGFIAGLLFYLFSKLWFVGLFAFLWLGGMNWLTAVIRHSFMFSDLNNKLEEDIINKNPT